MKDFHSFGATIHRRELKFSQYNNHGMCGLALQILNEAALLCGHPDMDFDGISNEELAIHYLIRFGDWKRRNEDEEKENLFELSGSGRALGKGRSVQKVWTFFNEEAYSKMPKELKQIVQIDPPRSNVRYDEETGKRYSETNAEGLQTPVQKKKGQMKLPPSKMQEETEKWYMYAKPSLRRVVKAATPFVGTLHLTFESGYTEVIETSRSFGGCASSDSVAECLKKVQHPVLAPGPIRTNYEVDEDSKSEESADGDSGSTPHAPHLHPSLHPPAHSIPSGDERVSRTLKPFEKVGSDGRVIAHIF